MRYILIKIVYVSIASCLFGFLPAAAEQNQSNLTMWLLNSHPLRTPSPGGALYAFHGGGLLLHIKRRCLVLVYCLTCRFEDAAWESAEICII